MTAPPAPNVSPEGEGELNQADGRPTLSELHEQRAELDATIRDHLAFLHGGKEQ
jgi:hypothetical protein